MAESRGLFSQFFYVSILSLALEKYGAGNRKRDRWSRNNAWLLAFCKFSKGLMVSQFGM